MRARTLVALGLMMVGIACAPAVSVAATGGAGAPSSSTPAKSSGDQAPAPAPATPQDQAGGAAFGSVPAILHPTVPGSVGVIRNGIAYAPAAAPLPVQQAIWAANTLRNKPYIYGGGHQSFTSRGYDCSGTVSYALHAAGLLRAPLDSSDFMHWGQHGRGQWITIYTNPGHAWTVIAGLRLDTAGARRVRPALAHRARLAARVPVRHPVGY